MTKFDPTKPVQTRGGLPVRIICSDRKDSEIPIVALIDKGDGGEAVECYRADGTAFSRCNSDRDLVNLPERKRLWLNITKGGASVYRHKTEEEARRNASLSIVYDHIAFMIEYEVPNHG
jgi:hypothetical protein